MTTSEPAARAFHFLVNPTAGGGAGPGVVVPLARALREAGAQVAVTHTTGPEQSPGLVREAVAAGQVVVSVGGDGMLSSVAGEVAAAGGVLAVVPAGRGNDFARMLGIPQEYDALVPLLLEGEPRPIDLLTATLPGREPRVVAGSVYCGLDARAAAMVDRSHLPARLQYPVAAVRALATYRPVEAVLEIDGRRSEHRAATVVIANSAYYGQGMQIAPTAAVSDGLLDIVVIEAATRKVLLRALPKVYDGSHLELPEVTVHRGESVRLTGAFAGGAAVPVGADGEPLGSLPARGDALEVAIRPDAIRIIA